MDGGYTFYVKDGKLHYGYNYVAEQYYHVASAQPVPEGRHQLRYEFQVTGKPDIMKGKGTPGTGRLYIDGKPVGEIQMPVTTPLAMSLGGGITCGANPGSPVTPEYEPPFEFTGTIYGVTVDVSGDAITHPEGAMRAVMAHQ